MTRITKACTPTLPPEEVNELCRRYAAGDSDALDLLVSSHVAFVTSVANRYGSLGVPIEDLISEGILGLIEAVKRFDTERGHRFLTYAVFWIRRHILDSLRRDSQPIRRPRKAAQTAEPAVAHRGSGVSKTVSMADARNLAVSPEPLQFQSIDHATVGSDEASTMDTLEDPSAECPEGTLLRDDTRRVVWTALERLRPNQQLVVALRNGLWDDKNWTLRQVGQLIGVSRERVRQIEMQAVEQLRRGLRRASAPPIPMPTDNRTRRPLGRTRSRWSVRKAATAAPVAVRRARTTAPRPVSPAFAGVNHGSA